MSTCWYGCCGRVIAACLLAIYCANETCGIGKQFPKQRGLDSWKREETPANWWKRNKKRHRLSEHLIWPFGELGKLVKGFCQCEKRLSKHSAEEGTHARVRIRLLETFPKTSFSKSYA